MNSIPLWDVQAGFGGTTPGIKERIGAEVLCASMGQLSIDRALVRIEPTILDYDLERSNARLYEACAASGNRLLPAPVLAPDSADDLAPETEQVDQAIAAGALAGTLRPDVDRWHVQPWCAGTLYRAMQERRLPALCSSASFSVDHLATIAEAYPNLPLIYTGMNYHHQRILAALLERFPSIHLSIGSNYAISGGIEQLCRRTGAGQLLFGTGFPDAEPAAAVGLLLYADLADEQKQRIGSLNLKRLQEGIR